MGALGICPGSNIFLLIILDNRLSSTAMALLYMDECKVMMPFNWEDYVARFQEELEIGIIETQIPLLHQH